MRTFLLGVRACAAILSFVPFSTALNAQPLGPEETDNALMAENPDYYTIGEIEVVGETDGVFSLDAPLPPIVTQRPPGTSQIPGAGLADIRNYFDWAWRIIDSNRAVLNVERPPFASALPGDLSDFTEMESWAFPPKAVPFSLVIKNLVGVKVMEAEYFVQFTYGASHNGRGEYLNNVMVVPGNIMAQWGFKVDVGVQIANVLNFGTKEDPVGGVQIVLHIDSKGLNSQHIARSYVVRGDGRLEEVRPGQYRAMAW